MTKGRRNSVDHWNNAGNISSVKPCDRERIQLVDSVCTSEFIYYEMFRYNNTFDDSTISGTTFGNQGLDVPATFTENRSQPILEKPSDYKFAVCGFSIPADIIPMFRIDPGITNERFTVSMVVNYDGRNPPFYLFYDDYMFSPNSPYANVFAGGNYLYNINIFILELNNLIGRVFYAIQFEYNTLAVAGGDPLWDNSNINLPSVPAFINFDNQSQLFSIYGPIQMNNVQVFFNGLLFSDNLANLFSGFNFVETLYVGWTPPNQRLNYRSLAKRVYFYIKPEYINYKPFTNPNSSAIQYIQIEQPYSSIENWYKYNKLVISSNSLGIRYQAVGFQKDIFNNNDNNGDNNNITKNIVADYDLILNYSVLNNPTSRLIYQATPYRWIDMFSDSPLYKLDCQIYLLNHYNDYLPLNITSGDNFNVKFVFAKIASFN